MPNPDKELTVEGRTYRTIVADPPWPYPSPGSGPLQSSPTHRPHSYQNILAGVGAKNRYGLMSIPEIRALNIPADINAHLYLWTTNAFMVEAHLVAESWGFSPKTIISWVKIKATGEPSMKTGYYYRGATEHCLFAVKGSLSLKGPAAPTALLTPRTPHSVKPELFYSMVEEQSHGPYLEMFARRRREGWDAWGDEID